ncbi:helix-turn-helix transcriptional regulator [Nonomuraea sp. NPDC052634]|uniref:helix-turn-helix domain-containing protein n=1 Tax=Nonomuraea sp. NPDC052634 TaxID=3155813 RepID=UPI00343D620B
MQRRILARELRHLRERKSLTGDDIKDLLGWSPSKVSRIENARISVSQKDIEQLLDVYDATDSQRERLLALAGKTQTPQSWRAYPAPTQEYLSFLDVERVADSIRQWEVGVVPGVFQTEAYARHLIKSWRDIDPTLTPLQIEDRVAIRLARQKRFLPPESAQIWIIMDESILLRTVGGPEVMAEQLRQLVDFSLLPNVKLQVAPLSRPRGVFEESFTLLNLDRNNPLEQCLVYIDHNLTSQFLLDEQRSVYFEKMFDHFRELALDPEESRQAIHKELEKLQV